MKMRVAGALRIIDASYPFQPSNTCQRGCVEQNKLPGEEQKNMHEHDEQSSDIYTPLSDSDGSIPAGPLMCSHRNRGEGMSINTFYCPRSRIKLTVRGALNKAVSTPWSDGVDVHSHPAFCDFTVGEG